MNWYEESQGGRTAGIGVDPDKLGKQHDEQDLDLVLGARAALGQLTVQALHLAIRHDQLVGHIARARLASQQDARNRGGIQAVGLGPQAALLRERMRLAWMQQAQHVALRLEKLVQVFTVARGHFQPNQDALGWHSKVAEGRVHLHEARVVLGHFRGLDDGALVGLQDRVDISLTAHINAHHIGKAGRI